MPTRGTVLVRSTVFSIEMQIQSVTVLLIVFHFLVAPPSFAANTCLCRSLVAADGARSPTQSF